VEGEEKGEKREEKEEEREEEKEEEGKEEEGRGRRRKIRGGEGGEKKKKNMPCRLVNVCQRFVAA
jgi:hypothetical protein